jgi:hypothetical protein
LNREKPLPSIGQPDLNRDNQKAAFADPPDHAKQATAARQLAAQALALARLADNTLERNLWTDIATQWQQRANRLDQDHLEQPFD